MRIVVAGTRATPTACAHRDDRALRTQYRSALRVCAEKGVDAPAVEDVIPRQGVAPRPANTRQPSTFAALRREILAAS
jgi:hypothetical protein